MPDASQIAQVLVSTRRARLLLEMACWIHDLDKASWPFAVFAQKDRRIDLYSHDKHPHRSGDPDKWKWEKEWLIDQADADPDLLSTKLSFQGLIPENSSYIILNIRDHEKNTEKEIAISRANSAGLLSDFFWSHSTKDVNDLDEKSWERWLISSGGAGPDGIDSEFFKSTFYKQKAGEPQARTDILPRVATPFGFERMVLGGDPNVSEDFENFKKCNQELFKEIWKLALCWPESSVADYSNFLENWSAVRGHLRKHLGLALGYSNRPVNDVNLWAHSYSVGAMVKALAAALAIDSFAALENSKALLFPHRTPEMTLSKELNVNHYLLSQGCDPSKREDLERQVQTKFKVLSVLLRDPERLHVGRRIGDILGYHARRDLLFKIIAKLIEQKLAVGAEIFRDHGGIHFLVPWCQDSTDAHLDDPHTQKGTERSQEILQTMLLELVECVFSSKEAPGWLKNAGIEIGKSSKRRACDFDFTVQITPSREPMFNQSGELTRAGAYQAAYQGLIFLRKNTSIGKEIDANNPRRFDNANLELEKKVGITLQLCPICRKRASARKDTLGRENDHPCKVCCERRRSRLNDWWKSLCKSPNLANSTIWTGEAADGKRRVNLLTIAFDLQRWFDGRAFDGFWLNNQPGKEGEKVLPHLPIYPVPARIQGVWEATMAFLQEAKTKIGTCLTPRFRPAFNIAPEHIYRADKVKNKRGRLLTSKSGLGRDLGSWFIGRSGNGYWLLSLENFTDESGSYDVLCENVWKAFNSGYGDLVWIDKEGEERKAFNDSISGIDPPKFSENQGTLFSQFTPLVEILTNSPTRFQLLIPGEKTVEALQKVHGLFIEHFGKVAHNIEVAVNCLTFKEKFPFYLALEAADRFTENELKDRCAFSSRICRIDGSGLKVSIGRTGNEIDSAFFEEGYEWECHRLSEHRDEFRSMVVDVSNGPKGEGKGVFYGWKGNSLIKMERLRYQPEMKGFYPDPLKKIFERTENYKHTDKKQFNVSCPRLSWSHLASSGERHRDQMSIPLLAMEDWKDAWDALIHGSRETNCRECREKLEKKHPEFNSDTLVFPGKLRGLYGQPSKLRGLIEEIIEAHALWPEKFQLTERELVIKEHIHRLFNHPNACGYEWHQWREIKRCPLEELKRGKDQAIKKSAIEMTKPQKKCIQLAGRLPSAIARLEAMAANDGGRPLMITFNLLYTLCGQGVKY
jgi:hypothetical protein